MAERGHSVKHKAHLCRDFEKCGYGRRDCFAIVPQFGCPEADRPRFARRHRESKAGNANGPGHGALGPFGWLRSALPLAPQRAACADPFGAGGAAVFIASGLRRAPRCQGMASCGPSEAAITDFNQRRSFFIVGSLAFCFDRVALSTLRAICHPNAAGFWRRLWQPKTGAKSIVALSPCRENPATQRKSAVFPASCTTVVRMAGDCFRQCGKSAARRCRNPGGHNRMHEIRRP